MESERYKGSRKKRPDEQLVGKSWVLMGHKPCIFWQRVGVGVGQRLVGSVWFYMDFGGVREHRWVSAGLHPSRLLGNWSWWSKGRRLVVDVELLVLVMIDGDELWIPISLTGRAATWRSLTSDLNLNNSLETKLEQLLRLVA